MKNSQRNLSDLNSYHDSDSSEGNISLASITTTKPTMVKSKQKLKTREKMYFDLSSFSCGGNYDSDHSHTNISLASTASLNKCEKWRGKGKNEDMI